MNPELGQFSPGFESFRRQMAAAPEAMRLQVFVNMCGEAATYVAKGLDRTVCADELVELATANGMHDADAVQFVISKAFAAIQEPDRVPDDIEPQHTNGHAKAAPELGPLPLLRAFPIDEKTIPPRDWIIPGLFARRQVSVIVAPSGSGKSLLTLQLAIACALKMEWAGWRPRNQFRIMIINSEDDFDEVRRRFAAAVHVMQVDQDTLHDRVFVTESEHYIVAKFDNKTKTLVKTPMLDRVIATVNEANIDLIFVDPFAETFEGDENSNSELKWAGMMWRHVARQTRCAVCLVHHTKKYATGMAGDVDAARGAGALIGIARIVSTLFPMTVQEATTMGVEEARRAHYLRYDDAKANLNLKSVFARWFIKETITLDNARDEIPGDLVGALVPWAPEGLFAGITQEQIDDLMKVIDRGMLTKSGQLADFYTLNRKNQANRWVGKLLKMTFNCSDKRAAEMIEAWEKSELLVSFPYRSPTVRKLVQGCGSKQLAERVQEEQQSQTVIKFPKK